MSIIERVEGRRHAIDALGLHSLSRVGWRAVAQGEVARNLRDAHAGVQRDYSKGVMEVVDALAKS